jgi:hypothetical protein
VEEATMIDQTPTTEELRHAWHDARRAAELAERLTALALEAVRQADIRAVETAEVAELVRQTAEAAARAAQRATAAAAEAAGIAETLRGEGQATTQAGEDARRVEAAADAAYHDGGGQVGP